MYVFVGLFSLVFSRFTVAGVSFVGGSAGAVTGYFDLLTKGPVISLGGSPITVGKVAAGSGGLAINTGIFGLLVMYLVNYVIAFVDIVLAGLVHVFVAPGESVIAVVTLIIGLIGFVVVLIVTIINFFKILLLLAKTFLAVILMTIFAPLIFTFGAILPGVGLGSWIKSYATKLATFVGVGIMFIFSLWFLQFAVDSANNPDPVAFPQGWPPLLGGSPQMLGLAFLLVSIAIFVMIPKVGDMIEGFISGKA